MRHQIAPTGREGMAWTSNHPIALALRVTQSNPSVPEPPKEALK
jgi:hypothetical protein